MTDTNTLASPTEDEVNDQRAAAIEHGMVAAGVPIAEKRPVDYFGFDETNRYVLPDGIQWIEHKTLNEGARRKYLNAVNRDVTIKKASGDAVMRIATGDEKAALLGAAICNWNLFRNGTPISFNATSLSDFLQKAPPTVVDGIHADVLKANSWLTADVSIEDIDKEIAELQEARAIKVTELEGKAAS